MNQFEITLKNDRIKSYDRISWLAVALNFFAFIYIGYLLRGHVDSKWPLLGAILILLSIIFFWIRKKTKRNQLLSFSAPLIFALITWIQLKNYWLAAALLLLIIFQELAKKDLTVKFFSDKIIFPSFPKRTIEWNELNNVVMKDGLLTIDFKNDKLIQATIIDQGFDKEVNEAAFNEFCSAQLTVKKVAKASA